MKTFFLTALCFFFLSTSQAQTIDGKSISEIKAKYLCLIALPVAPADGKHIGDYFIYVSYGQRRPLDIVQHKKGTPLTNRAGEPVTLYTVAQALNFFDKLGYELVSSESDQYVQKRILTLRKR
jgi:hypothetical protein